MDHLDNLNDIALDCETKEEALHSIKRYCEDNDLDPDGYDLFWEEDAISVEIAE